MGPTLGRVECPAVSRVVGRMACQALVVPALVAVYRARPPAARTPARAAAECVVGLVCPAAPAARSAMGWVVSRVGCLAAYPVAPAARQATQSAACQAARPV